MNSTQELFEPEHPRARKSGLFEIVQAVATELGEYRQRNAKFLMLELEKEIYFQRNGLSAGLDFLKIRFAGRRFLKAYVSVGDNQVFAATATEYSLPYDREPIYEPGAWETQLFCFYEQALQLRANREARRDSIRQRIRAFGNRSCASIFPVYK